MARKALGKGLGALIGEEAAKTGGAAKAAGETVTEVAVDTIVPSTLQPRKNFREQDLEELTASIRERGVIQPLIVRAKGAKYELIAGERRWRASQAAGRRKVPVIIRKADDMEVLEMALVENLQRSDLNPVEEADGYARLGEAFNLTQEQIAQKVGKSRAAVANALRLRSLEATALELLKMGSLSVGHAKVLLALETKKQQGLAAREIIKKDLSVRQTESLIRTLKSGGARSKSGRGKGRSQADWKEVETALKRKLGTRVKIIGSAQKGKIEIIYTDGSELERLLSELGVDLD
jgi:ParB family chromosome partitioning protein